MKKKYTRARVALFIGLFSFHIFSSCVHTRQQLGVNVLGARNCICMLTLLPLVGHAPVPYVPGAPLVLPSPFKPTMPSTSNENLGNNSVKPKEELDTLKRLGAFDFNNPTVDDIKATSDTIIIKPRCL